MLIFLLWWFLGCLFCFVLFLAAFSTLMKPKVCHLLVPLRVHSCFAEHQNCDLGNCMTFGLWITVSEILMKLGCGNILYDVVNVIHSMEGGLKMEVVPFSLNRSYKIPPTFSQAFLVPCLPVSIWGKNVGFWVR